MTTLQSTTAEISRAVTALFAGCVDREAAIPRSVALVRGLVPDYLEVRVSLDPLSKHGIVVTLTGPAQAHGLFINLDDGSFITLVA